MFTTCVGFWRKLTIHEVTLQRYTYYTLSLGEKEVVYSIKGFLKSKYIMSTLVIASMALLIIKYYERRHREHH